MGKVECFWESGIICLTEHALNWVNTSLQCVGTKYGKEQHSLPQVGWGCGENIYYCIFMQQHLWKGNTGLGIRKKCQGQT